MKLHKSIIQTQTRLNRKLLLKKSLIFLAIAGPPLFFSISSIHIVYVVPFVVPGALWGVMVILYAFFMLKNSTYQTTVFLAGCISLCATTIALIVNLYQCFMA